MNPERAMVIVAHPGAAVVLALAGDMEGASEDTLTRAEAHLTEALTRCRRINLVESEPDILLAWARWHRTKGHTEQAQKDAEEALTIADRCEYRLAQADIHNFLARLALDAGDKTVARQQAQIARERAWCDAPPHCYKPALEEAERLLAEAERAPEAGPLTVPARLWRELVEGRAGRSWFDRLTECPRRQGRCSRRLRTNALAARLLRVKPSSSGIQGRPLSPCGGGPPLFGGR